MAATDFDIIIIGSGAGGGTIAHALAGTTARILILERGDFVPQEQENWDPEAVWKHLRYRTTERWLDERGNQFRPYAHYCVGGNTKFWGAVLYRMRREDFEPVEHVDGVSPAWPIDYDVLEPYYERADQTGAVIGFGGEIEEMAQWSSLKIHDNIIIIFSRCPHLCCIPGWQLVANDFTADNWLPGGLDSGGNKLFCICHSSRYDPTVIEKNTNRNRRSGTVFDYFGVKRTGGPAPVGMPLVPFTVKNDVLEVIDFEAEGIVEMMDWYTFCN